MYVVRGFVRLRQLAPNFAGVSGNLEADLDSQPLNHYLFNYTLSAQEERLLHRLSINLLAFERQGEHALLCTKNL